MKIYICVLTSIILNGTSSAGLINWQSAFFNTDPQAATINLGDVVALYIDVNNDSTLTGLVVNTDYTVNTSSSTSVFSDDVFSGFFTTVVAPSGIPVPGLKTIDPKFDIDVSPDNENIYTVIFDSPTLTSSSLGLISDDHPFAATSGSITPPSTALDYYADGNDGSLAGVMGNITVIPEPTTIAVLLMGVLGLVGFRKHLRK